MSFSNFNRLIEEKSDLKAVDSSQSKKLGRLKAVARAQIAFTSNLTTDDKQQIENTSDKSAFAHVESVFTLISWVFTRVFFALDRLCVPCMLLKRVRVADGRRGGEFKIH
ncbi:hypothetical protein [Marinoscillum furvescens]|uniref:hypothetical protein n=1 Tax=Marinoscillum furvescens TaxID=1026 RepID=UPI0011C079C9|nr:hypothetical protein [Marinoscillum furvescens]